VHAAEEWQGHQAYAGDERCTKEAGDEAGALEHDGLNLGERHPAVEKI